MPMYFKIRRGTSGATSALPLRYGIKDQYIGKYIFECVLVGALCV
jgi:hypothetical protein